MPRDITAAPENGSMLPIACTRAVVETEKRGLCAVGQQHADAAARDQPVVGARARPDLNIVEQSHVSATFRIVGIPIGTMRPSRSVKVDGRIGVHRAR